MMRARPDPACCEAAQTRGGRAQVDNVVVKTWGERREEDGLRNHVDLVLLLDLVDLEAGTAVAGVRLHAAVFARAPAWPLRPAGGAVLCRAAKRRAAGAWCPACSHQQHAPQSGHGAPKCRGAMLGHASRPAFRYSPACSVDLLLLAACRAPQSSAARHFVRSGSAPRRACCGARCGIHRPLACL